MIDTESLLQTDRPHAHDVLDVNIVSAALARAHPELRMRIVSATLIGHSPGKRLVVSYTAAGSQGTERFLIGKAYADPARAERLHSVLTRLHGARATSAAVPRPVALLPELGLTLQETARGHTLDQTQGRGRLEALASAAHWLSELHTLEIGFERTLNLASELRKIGEWAELAGSLGPDVAGPAVRLAERLRAMGADVDAAHAAPIHKDFQYAHVLVALGQVTIIDLDEVRTGDPALDVAHFCAYLQLLAMREELSPRAASRLENTFLEAYGSGAGSAGDARRRFFYAYSCLKIAKQLVRGRGPEPVPSGAARDAQVRAVLREGLCTTE